MSKNITLTVPFSLDKETLSRSAAAAAVKYLTDRGEQDEAIAGAVESIFDQYRGTSINMPALASMACQRLNVQPENFNSVEERVLDYVRANADLHEKKDKAGKVVQTAEAPRTRLFAIGKGKGGGVKRWSDQPDATETESE